jgi:TetR/AcrR family transcriptional repressor of nem operon
MGRTSNAKERLQRVAFELIWDNSYGSVSVDRICQKAGVNKGSFYHFFKTKADLAVNAYEMYWHERQPELDRIFSPQVPPLERLSRWCDYLRRRQQEKAAEFGHVCGCPYSSVGVEMATQDEKVRRKVEELIERHVRYLESAIAGACMDGVISTPDPKGVARRIYSYALGLLLQARIHNDLSFLDDLKPSVMTLLDIGKAAA